MTTLPDDTVTTPATDGAAISDELTIPIDPAKAARIAAINAEEDRLGKIVAQKAKAVRDEEFFRRTPWWMIPTSEEQKAKRKEAAAFEVDLATAMYSGIPFNQIPNPVSNRGKEAKAMREAAEKREKRRTADKARRDRKRANT